MSSINNLKGTIVKDGKIIYEEKIKEGMYFYVIMKYKENKTNNWFIGNCEIECYATIGNGSLYNWSNGVKEIEEYCIIEKAIIDKKQNINFENPQKIFSEIPDTIFTKKDFNIFFVRNIKINEKNEAICKTKAYVEISKKELLKFMINEIKET